MTIENLVAAVADVTREQAKILAHYAAGEAIAEIADNTGLSRSEVTSVVETLARNNRNLAQNLAVAWRRQNPATPAPPRLVVPVPPADPPRPGDTIADLLDRAVASDVPRLVRAADKIRELLDHLETQVAEHERGAELRAEAERLEARLNEIKGQLGHKRTTTAAPAAQQSHKEANRAVREWAAANNIPCPARGRVPATVWAAYREATS